MTRDEFGILVKAMKSVFTDPKFIPDQYAFDVWYELLADLDYRTASKAVQRCISTSKYAPTIAEIREQYQTLTSPAKLTGMEAWALVSRAIRNAGYHSQDEYDKLPPDVQKAIGSPTQLYYMSLDENFNEDVARANFLRSYQTICGRAQTEQALPERVRTLTETFADRLETAAGQAV